MAYTPCQATFLIMKWKKGIPKIEGYYVIILNPKNLIGGRETPQLAYFNGKEWTGNTRGLNEPIDYWCQVPIFDKKWCVDRWL